MALVESSYLHDSPDHVALDVGLFVGWDEFQGDLGGDRALSGAACGAVVGKEYRRHRTRHGDDVGCVQNVGEIASQSASPVVGRDESANVTASQRGASSRSGIDSRPDSNRHRVAAEHGKRS